MFKADPGHIMQLRKSGELFYPPQVLLLGHESSVDIPKFHSVHVSGSTILEPRKEIDKRSGYIGHFLLSDLPSGRSKWLNTPYQYRNDSE